MEWCRGLCRISFLSVIPQTHVSFVVVDSFSADGKYCLTGGHDRSVRLWNPFRVDPAHPPTARQQISATINDGPDDVVDSYYGPPPPSSSADIRLDELPRAMPIQTYTGGLTHPVSAVAVVESSETQQLLLAACDKALVVMDLVTNQVVRRFQGHVGRINAVDAAPHAEAYVSGGYDGTVCIWDGRSSRDYKPIQVLKDAKDSVTDLYVVPQAGGGSAAGMGLIRTASVDGMVRTYDLRMGIVRNDNCHSSITSMASTYDGQCLAISCLDGTIRLMELETGALLNTYQGSHQAGQYGLGVAILADDATIVSGSEDGHGVCYDLVRATCVQSLQTWTPPSTPQDSLPQQPRPTCAIAAHPQQSSVVMTTSYDESAIVWANDSAIWNNQMLQE